jgi:transposase
MTNAAIATLGIDLAKYSFQIVGQNAAGVIVTTKKLSKTQLLAMTAKMPRCLIGMESTSGAMSMSGSTKLRMRLAYWRKRRKARSA